MTEIWFIPNDANCVEDIFNAMKACQVLHPDPNDSFSDDGDDNDFIMAQDEEHDDGNHGDHEENMRNLNLDGNSLINSSGAPA